MDDLTTLFALAVVMAAALAGIGIWAPRRLWIRAAALATAALFVPVVYAALAGLLSRPKPVDLEWMHGATTEAAVLAATIDENDGIYVWLRFADAPEPRAYVLPWDREVAEQLQGALREAERNDTGVIMNLPFEHSWDPRQPKFYALPQPALPPKDAGQAPEAYEHPGQET
ncbi:MAG: hypothetical protein WD673_03390 [Alphaproteobacteria bacterium]